MIEAPVCGLSPPRQVMVPVHPLAVRVIDVPGQIAGLSGVMVMTVGIVQFLESPEMLQPFPPEATGVVRSVRAVSALQ